MRACKPTSNPNPHPNHARLHALLYVVHELLDSFHATHFSCDSVHGIGAGLVRAQRLLVYVDHLELRLLRLERKLGVRDLVHPVRPRERDGREQAYGRESSSAPTHCFSNIFFRLMHVSASRFFPFALNSLACLISFSIFRMRWSSRFCSIS